MKEIYNRIWELVADKLGDNTLSDMLTDQIMDVFNSLAEAYEEEIYEKDVRIDELEREINWNRMVRE